MQAWLFIAWNEKNMKLLFADTVELSDGQITRQGFLQLNQLEAEDNDEDLWITLSAMGYNNALVMDEVLLCFSHCSLQKIVLEKLINSDVIRSNYLIK